MKITVAGNKKEYEDGITVAELIVKENVENPEYVTVTVNDDFVERDDFETTKLNAYISWEEEHTNGVY